MFTVLGLLSKFAVLNSVTCTATTIEGEEGFQRCLLALDSETHTYMYILKQRDHPISRPRAFFIYFYYYFFFKHPFSTSMMRDNGVTKP